jgi:hypothetical protein
MDEARIDEVNDRSDKSIATEKNQGGMNRQKVEADENKVNPLNK